MRFDVIVIGGGHAGVEAATAAARVGASVALMTPSAENLGMLSCNPAVGGIGKGHLVREIDAFDGVIARAADRAAIHRRLLNRSKGPAVQGPRVQTDRQLFATAVRQAITREPNVSLITDRVDALLVEGGRVAGVLAADVRYSASATILCTGTFLRGRLFRGHDRSAGGRENEEPAGQIGDQFRELEPKLGRLKTGTPPRLDARSIDWTRVERQASDTDQWWMSYDRLPHPPQLFCGVTATTEQTHDLIRAARDASPLYSGAIEGRGPRYCPSIEDKVVRFADRPSHQIFLEPEGLRSTFVYPNGVSTSLPAETQQAFIRTVPGLEQAVLLRPGYAVEYDHLDPRSLDHSLAHRELKGLFCAGQINGTTGYEEAAAQGLVAGLAAGLQARGREPIRFERERSYIGVMVDDLTRQGVSEPYRMLTARSENRLYLRADNAETRLLELAMAAGSLSQERATASRCRAERKMELMAEAAPSIEGADDVLLAEIDADRLYAPYVERQARENARIARESALRLRLDYDSLPGLSNEMRERLQKARPETLGAARQVQGVTPAAVALLMMHARAA